MSIRNVAGLALEGCRLFGNGNYAGTFLCQMPLSILVGSRCVVSGPDNPKERVVVAIQIRGPYLEGGPLLVPITHLELPSAQPGSHAAPWAHCARNHRSLDGMHTGYMVDSSNACEHAL
jgi:hypothetical protein